MYPYSFGEENKFLCARLSTADPWELLFQCFGEWKLGKKWRDPQVTLIPKETHRNAGDSDELHQ